MIPTKLHCPFHKLFKNVSLSKKDPLKQNRDAKTYTKVVLNVNLDPKGLGLTKSSLQQPEVLDRRPPTF